MDLHCLKAALTFGYRGNCFNVKSDSSDLKLSVLLGFVHLSGCELFQWETVSKHFIPVWGLTYLKSADEA